MRFAAWPSAVALSLTWSLVACGGEDPSQTDLLAEVRDATPSDPALRGGAVEVDEGVSLIAYTQQEPRNLGVPPDAHERALEQLQGDPDLAEVRDALQAAGASEEQLREAVTEATYFRSGDPDRDPSWEQWRQARDYVDDAVLEAMAAIEAEEAKRGVRVDRDELEELTRLPSLVERARARQTPVESAPPGALPAGEPGCLTDCASPSPSTPAPEGGAR